MEMITVNSIKTKRIVESTDDVHFVINSEIDLYVNLEEETTLTLLCRIKPPFYLSFESKNFNKTISSKHYFKFLIPSFLIPNEQNRKIFELSAEEL
jgi:hypothetical protein